MQMPREHPKIWTKCFYRSKRQQKDADGMANSVDPEQSVLFVQSCLSESLGMLRYLISTVAEDLFCYYCDDAKFLWTDTSGQRV